MAGQRREKDVCLKERRKNVFKKGEKMEEEDRQAPTTNLFFLFSRKDNDDDNDSDEIMTR